MTIDWKAAGEATLAIIFYTAAMAIVAGLVWLVGSVPDAWLLGAILLAVIAFVWWVLYQEARSRGGDERRNDG